MSHPPVLLDLFGVEWSALLSVVWYTIRHGYCSAPISPPRLQVSYVQVTPPLSRGYPLCNPNCSGLVDHRHMISAGMRIETLLNPSLDHLSLGPSLSLTPSDIEHHSHAKRPGVIGLCGARTCLSLRELAIHRRFRCSFPPSSHLSSSDDTPERNMPTGTYRCVD